MDNTIRILVLCTGNRCRSQMAEGWLRHFASQRKQAVQVCSAGTEPKGVHPLAIQVMAEAGVDISGQPSEHVDTYAESMFDFVVTVCDRAKEACPVYWSKSESENRGATRMIHRAFEDPDQFGLSDEQLLPVFHRVRDEIRDWAKQMMKITLIDC